MAEMSRKAQISIAASSMFPGFRFSPTDEELISYYLKKKLEVSDNCVEVISEVEINKYEPWDLPAKSVIQSENEWFFFSPRGRKYPNGSQSKRATEYGYWKATGKERNVKSGSNIIGTKRTLVFHTGRAPKGERTEWIMHEYCMSGNPQDSMVICRLRKNSEFRLSDSPRQGPSSQRHSPNENLSDTNPSEVGVEQPDLLGGAKTADCCSKEASSSYNSHSVEQQIDSESESDRRQTNKLSQPGTSHQGCEDEECYAEILKDDIIDLGKSLLAPTADLFPMVVEKSVDESKSQQSVKEISVRALPFQGTANRRIRLTRHMPEEVGLQPVDVEVSCKNFSVEESICPNLDQSPKYLWHTRIVNCRFLSVFLVSVALVLFVSSFVMTWHVKSTTYPAASL